MRELEEIIESINHCIERYETCKLGLISDQSEILRDLSTSLHWLSDYKVQAHNKWMSVWFNSKGKSEAAREREADFSVPELYQIRHFLNSGYKVLESIRSTLSANKSYQ